MPKTEWSTIPAPISLADGAFLVRPLVGARSRYATTYALHIMDRDGGSLGYIHGYTVLYDDDDTEAPIDPDHLAIDIRDWHDARTITPAGTRKTIDAMQQRDPAAFYDLIGS